MEKYKILFVDDEQNILNALKRLLHNAPYEIYVESSPLAALELVKNNQYAVVVSDHRMPEMLGTDLLDKVKEVNQESLRILLTGYADINTVTEAINKGAVYRFLTKPWDDMELRIVLDKAVEYYALKKKNEDMNQLIQKQNRELKVLNFSLEEKVKERTTHLEKALKALKQVADTLKKNMGEITNLLHSVVSLFQKELGSHLKRVGELTELVCENLSLDQSQKEYIISAAYLHDIGLLGESKDFFLLPLEQLDGTLKAVYLKHAEAGAELMGTMQSMSEVSRIILCHHESFNGSGFPKGLRGDQIPLGAYVIRIVNDFDDLITKEGRSYEAALDLIGQGIHKLYHPQAMKAFIQVIRNYYANLSASDFRINIKELKTGMVLEEDIILSNGLMLLPRGVLVTDKILVKIRSFSSLIRYDIPVRVKAQ